MDMRFYLKALRNKVFDLQENFPVNLKKWVDIQDNICYSHNMNNRLRILVAHRIRN